jgi:hypothetical protein
MTQRDRSSINRYVDAYKAGLKERESTARSGNRVEAAFVYITRWFRAVGGGRQSGGNPVTGVSTMLPASAVSKRKPWVISQLPA